jgi:dolichol kinase
VAPKGHSLSAPPPLALRHEFARKTLHLAAAVFPVAYSLGASRTALVSALAAMSAIALIVEGLRRWNASFRETFTRTVGDLTRQHEQHAITGATWLTLSCLVAVAVLSRSAAIAALWCATVGDPAATIAGRWSAQSASEPSVAPGKTLTGSVACALASFAGVWMVAGYPPLVAVVIAAAAALAEAWPLRIDDNIRVAGAAGVVAQLLA